MSLILAEFPFITKVSYVRKFNTKNYYIITRNVLMQHKRENELINRIRSRGIGRGGGDKGRGSRG